MVRQTARRPVADPGGSPVIAGRLAALDILSAVLDRDRPLDEAIEQALSQSGLEPRDRGFAHLLAMTVIRRLGQIDDALARLVSASLPLRPAALMNLLRLGAAQLLFLGTPPHAAVATSVDLADALGLGRGKGMVNAVLRRLSREGEAILGQQDAGRINAPGWLWNRWAATYGAETARRIAEQHLVEPPLDVTLKPGRDPQDWAKILGATVLPTGALRRPSGGRIEDLPGYAEGEWWVQDAAASLPVRLLGDLHDAVIYDLCAAPGGKTAQMAAAGAKVTAIDRSGPRLAFVARNLERLGLKATLVAADALAWRPPRGAPADAILLDAPCTATGTIRRHPDVALTKSPDDLGKLARLQAALLDHAATLLRPGGRLVYCVCSLEPEEGEAQIAAVLARRPELARAPVAPAEIGGLSEAITAAGDLRTLPCHLAGQGGMDGFFAARLIRQSPH
jgi:16S rRNA (cytosine967-C5)-methyltransferase